MRFILSLFTFYLLSLSLSLSLSLFLSLTHLLSLSLTYLATQSLSLSFFWILPAGSNWQRLQPIISIVAIAHSYPLKTVPRKWEIIFKITSEKMSSFQVISLPLSLTYIKTNSSLLTNTLKSWLTNSLSLSHTQNTRSNTHSKSWILFCTISVTRWIDYVFYIWQIQKWKFAPKQHKCFANVGSTFW